MEKERWLGFAKNLRGGGAILSVLLRNARRDVADFKYLMINYVKKDV